jgi:hypothetical protein
MVKKQAGREGEELRKELREGRLRCAIATVGREVIIKHFSSVPQPQKVEREKRDACDHRAALQCRKGCRARGSKKNAFLCFALEVRKNGAELQDRGLTMM